MFLINFTYHISLFLDLFHVQTSATTTNPNTQFHCVVPLYLVMQIQSVVESNIRNMDRDSLAGLIADILNKQTGSPPPIQKVRECFILSFNIIWIKFFWPLSLIIIKWVGQLVYSPFRTMHSLTIQITTN